MNAKRIALAVSGAVAAAMIGLPAMAQDPIKIGSSLPLTGGFAVTGTKHMEGFQMCVKMINDAGGLLGRPVELIVSDNRSDTETALAQYERLINVDGVDITFGTFSSKLSFPVSSVLNKYGMLHPIPSGGALRIWEQGFDNQFYFQQNAGEYAGRTVVNGLKALTGDDMPKTAALVHADDFFANAIRAGVTATPAAQKIPGYDRLSEAARTRNPGGRMTTTEDVARAIVVLSHPDTYWMTGNVIGVDGGEDIVG